MTKMNDELIHVFIVTSFSFNITNYNRTKENLSRSIFQLKPWLKQSNKRIKNKVYEKNKENFVQFTYTMTKKNWNQVSTKKK